MKKYIAKTENGRFFVGISEGANKTKWVTVEQGSGCAPTFWEVNRALGEIQGKEDIFHADRDGETWHPVIGWIQKDLLTYEEAPWRVIHREGMSGCEDYTLTAQNPSSKFGSEYRIATVHISMRGKFNQGLLAPIPLIEHLAAGRGCLEEPGWLEVKELPDKDEREWQTGGLI